ncbi:Eco57I restriction-modification methylase domain-containing protein [Bifidobacterium adolescentis]|uniref:Eco57I restriction-modification methylase domain-containing protein n=1 Tax=Bifidobacterium adolescentis TaxID=1680 RepID=UPI0018DEADE1
MTEPIHDISLEGFIKSFDRRYPTFILKTLLCDRTTGRNIIWADNEYEALGDGYMGDDEITVEKITGMNSGVIKPRIAKEQERQSQRTKSRAEVFTPSWLCNQMNNDLDEAWFGRRDVFNTEVVADDDVKTWMATAEPVTFPKSKGRGWHAYVEAPRLEITCGEAPFVCSRYDTVTGDELPVGERVGFLDRKLRIVTEKAKTRKEWGCRALDALRATYGFEYQGDNLLIARINVLETFAEHFRDRWGSDPERDELEQAAWIVSWNFWQMNGFTDAVPTNKMGAEVESTLGTFEEPEPEPMQPSLFDIFDDVFPNGTTEETKEEEPKETVPLCVIYDWQNGEPFEFATLKGKAAAMGKKFYAVIGNPPYQEQTDSESTRMPPIYHEFMEQSYRVSDKVELITPARFLFNAGYTPKAWNRKMLDDPHLKVLDYKQKSDEVFPNTDIKGGVVVTLRDADTDFGAISIFTAYNELNSIVKKTLANSTSFLNDIVYPALSYKATAAMTEEHRELLPRMKSKADPDPQSLRLRTNAFENLHELFYESKPDDGSSYIEMLGLVAGKRVYRWVDSRYIDSPDNLNSYKVMLPKSNGSGALGEVLSTPLIGQPLIGHTQTFISVGRFEDRQQAENCLKYIKSKYSRTLLGVLKITQDNPPEKWKYVPLQDFTSASDIDWTQSVADIDRQLYAKYGLDDEEIQFIESHVKEMD